LEKNNIPNLIITNPVIPPKAAHPDRITFLAAARNYVLKPLIEGRAFSTNRQTRVIFLNDIYYKAGDLLRLLLTNNLNYDMVCALDFNYNFYDIWVARDIAGELLTWEYPWFTDSTARKQVFQNKPIRVLSCWNGLVVFKADPLILANKTSDEGPNQRAAPLRFRISRSGEIWSSECLLFCKDLLRLGYERILINPTVKVSYQKRWYVLRGLCDFLQYVAMLFRKDNNKNDVPDSANLNGVLALSSVIEKLTLEKLTLS